MEPAELSVEPGGTVTTTVTVRNRGTRVEQFWLRIYGVPGQVARVDKPELEVFPDAEETAEITFAVPRRPWPPAGRAPFRVEVRSRVHHDVADQADGTLNIGAFHQVRAGMAPQTTRGGRRPGRHRISVVNDGNASVQARIDLSDRDGELSFRPPGFAVPVNPGQPTLCDVLVAGPHKLFGRAQTMPFEAKVVSAAAPTPILLSGTRRQLPRFPLWILIAAGAVFPVAMALLIFLLSQGPKIPPVESLDRAAALAKLQEDGYELVRFQDLPDDKFPADTVIKTSPAGGTEHPHDQAVVVYVSTGPCAGVCPVKVPFVSDLSADKAVVAVNDATLVGELQEPVEDAKPKGRVVQVNPPEGTELPPGSVVRVTPSAGPRVEPSPLPEPSKMPPLVTRPVEEGKAELERLGLGLVVVEKTEPSDDPAGTILKTIPAADVPLKAGATVTLTVAAAKANPDDCKAPLVWREARTDDHVCVTEEEKRKVKDENETPDANKEPGGGAYGPDTCVSGYVWREAFEGDAVCVLPERREKALADNAAAASNRVGG